MIDRKKIAQLCLWFLLVFAGVSLILDQAYDRWVIRGNAFSNLNTLERLMYEQHPSEIPVFGSSKARYSLISDSISPHVYNYAMPRCNFDVIEFLLNLELEKNKQTPILIEFNHRFFLHNPNYTINTATFIPNVHDARVKTFLKKYDRLEPYYFIPGLRYYGKYVNFINNDLRELLGNPKTFSKGSIVSKKQTPSFVFQKTIRGRYDAIRAREKLLKKMKDPKAIISLEEKHKLYYLDQLLLFNQDSARVRVFESLLNQNQDRVFIMVYTPQHPSEIDGVKNEHEMLAFWNNLTQKHSNLLFLNYSRLALPDSCFKDPSHLNIYGASRFCQKLRHDLKTNPSIGSFF